MSSAVTIGIDLGTTNSVVAYYDGREPRVLGARENDGLVPSVLSWQRAGDGSSSYLVGKPALNNWQAAPENTVLCVKRLLGRFYCEPQVQETRERFQYRVVEDKDKLATLEVGGKLFSPEEVSAEYLKVLRQRAESELGRKVSGAVITVPAYFEERQRAATRRAGEKAGLQVRKIIDEPTAAAIAFGLAAPRERHRLLVFDLGGGTFDISILLYTRQAETGMPMFEVQEIDGDNWLGGSDCDQRIVEYVIKDFIEKHKIDPRHDREFMTILRQTAELAKIRLSTEEKVDIRIPAAYRNEGKVLSVNLPLTRVRYEDMIAPEVERAIKAVQRALKSQSLDPEDITAVLLVGGATYTPLVRQRLASIFGAAKINSTVNAMTSVALGAAILAHQLRGIECPNPQCGVPEQIKDTSSGKILTRLKHHINPEDRTTCEKCATPLAAGRAVMEGISITDVTACSLGILAVKGNETNAYVPLIPKGKNYPLPEPIRKTFHPMASNTRLIRVPVYEALDENGLLRKPQGEVRYELAETITANTPVEVAFNLDRNRVVTVSITVKDSNLPPRQEQLQLGEPPADPGAPSKKLSWPDELGKWMRFASYLLKRYEKYLEPEGLQADKLREDLRRAEQILDRADQHQPPTLEVQKIIAVLSNDVEESGAATELFLGDLAKEEAREVTLQNQIEQAQKDVMAACDVRDWPRKELCVAALRTLLLGVWKQRDSGRKTRVEDLINPIELLRAD